MAKNLKIQNGYGETIEIALLRDGTRDVGQVFIDGVPYHIERMKSDELMSEYKIDTDPDYSPQRDKHGRCVLIAPYCKS